MRRLFLWSAVAVALASALPASAQQGPGGGVNPQRDCQTLLSCQFKRGGNYRGCVSSYSCRYCTFVNAKCSIPGSRGRVCREMRCSWG